MIGAILSFFTWLLGRLFGKPAGPSQEAVASASAAAAQTQLATVETADAQVQKAVDARRAADAVSVRDPDSLRAPDPNSRD